MIQYWRRPRVVVHDAMAHLWFSSKLERLQEQLRIGNLGLRHVILAAEAEDIADALARYDGSSQL